MKPPRSFAVALASAPTRNLEATLVRRVPLTPLIASGSVDYLFMSGRPYRFNAAGVSCVYFAEDEATAAAEYERHTRPLRQPFATYFAEVEFSAILDLCSPATVKALGLTTRDFQANWARPKRPTAAQLLGEAVGQQTGIAAIRFPSDAARGGSPRVISAEPCGGAMRLEPRTNNEIRWSLVVCIPKRFVFRT